MESETAECLMATDLSCCCSAALRSRFPYYNVFFNPSQPIRLFQTINLFNCLFCHIHFCFLTHTLVGIIEKQKWVIDESRRTSTLLGVVLWSPGDWSVAANHWATHTSCTNTVWLPAKLLWMPTTGPSPPPPPLSPHEVKFSPLYDGFGFTPTSL